MAIQTLKATRRDKIGTRYARRLRDKGQIPAIIYGHGETPESIALTAHDLSVELKQGTQVLSIDLGEGESQLLIKDIQYDYLGTTPIHLDLVRVSLDEKIQVSVEIQLRGTAKGLADGGVLEQGMNSIEVECLLTSIPEVFHPLVTHLGIGDSLLVSDLDLSDGVTALVGGDERVAWVAVKVEAAEVEEEDAEDGEVTQPEIIGKGKKEEEGGAE